MKFKFFALLFISSTVFMYSQSGNVGINTTNPGSTLSVNGSFSALYNNITDVNYDMKENDFYVSWLGNSRGTLNLPNSETGTDRQGRMYYIKNLSHTYTLTVDADGTELIDGYQNVILKPEESVLLMKTGDNSATGATYELVVLSKTDGDYIYSVSSVIPEDHHQGITYKADFSSIDFSTNGGGDFDLTTDKWTCPKSGFYKIEFLETGFHTALNVAAHRLMSIYKNGVSQTQQYYTMVLLGVSATQRSSGYDTTFLNLEKGDKIECNVTFCNGCGASHMTSSVRKMIITKL